MRNRILLAFAISIFLLKLVTSAYYVTSPTACPSSDGVNFPGQNCAPQDICGSSSGIAQCYDTSTIFAPAGSSTTSGSGGTDYSCSDATCSGGFVTDCYATIDASAPFCDNSGNFLIDRNATCYNKHTQTTATGEVFAASTCSATCTTNYFQCDGSTTDADGCEINAGSSCGSGTGTIVNNQCYSASAGNCTRSSDYLDCDNDDSDSNTITCNGANGCEIDPGSSCTVGGLSGTYSTSCSGGAGVCVVSKSYFETGTNTQYSTNATEHFLWGTDYGLIGDLLRLNNTNYGMFRVNVTGCIIWFDGTSTCTNPTGSGDITSVLGDIYITNGSSNGDVNLRFNETKLNATIDNRDSDTTYSAESNLTLTGTTFALNGTSLKNWLDTLYQIIGSYLLVSDLPLTNRTISHWDNVTNKPMNLDTDSTNDLLITDLPLHNRTLVNCLNITGDDADFCNDATGSGGLPIWINTTSGIDINSTYEKNINISRKNLTLNDNLLFGSPTERIYRSGGNLIFDASSVHVYSIGGNVEGGYFNNAFAFENGDNDTSITWAINGQLDFNVDSISKFFINQTNIVFRKNVIAQENITSNWFKGLFNWTSGDAFTSFNGAVLTLTSSATQWFYNQTTPAQTYADNNFLKLTGGQLTGNVNFSSGANQTIKINISR